jgi:hypothetical protein
MFWCVAESAPAAPAVPAACHSAAHTRLASKSQARRSTSAPRPVPAADARPRAPQTAQHRPATRQGSGHDSRHASLFPHSPPSSPARPRAREPCISPPQGTRTNIVCRQTTTPTHLLSPHDHIALRNTPGLVPSPPLAGTPYTRARAIGGWDEAGGAGQQGRKCVSVCGSDAPRGAWAAWCIDLRSRALHRQAGEALGSGIDDWVVA